MRSGPNNSQQNLLTKAQLEEQQQQVILLRELGLNWPSLLQSASRGNFQQQQQNELIKHFSKSQQPQSSYSNIQHQRELTPKRPSLIQDFGQSNMPQNSRYSLIQPHLQQAQAQSSSIGTSQSSDTSYLTEEEEKLKRHLAEKLAKIDREKTQSAAMQKNAEKKAKSCEKLLAKASQEPSFISAMENEDNDDENRNGQSAIDALINRIYAENRRKAAAANPLPTLNPSENNRQLMQEDAIRLKEEYERGLQLLPDLIKAMKIQREKRQDIIEQKRIVYEELLNNWEKKVIAHEKNKKKLARDIKHREIFEKTFVELRKMREEKERSNRGVERIRFSLAQGGIANIPPLTSSSNGTSQIGEDQMEIDQENRQELFANKQGDVDEKVFSSCVVPPVYSNRPRRFFDNRNGIVENALADSRSQLEAFQIAWSDAEKAVFLEKIYVYGKNFSAIAAFLPLKSVKDCVYFYYMTKKRNNYKAKFSRRRKKLGRQGYRPPVMPRFGDTNENLENYGRGCTFVECLLCDSRILVLESLTQRQSHQFEEFLTNSNFDSTGVGSLGEDIFSQQEKYQEMPICTKCQTLAQRNRTLNRCPLGSCVCFGGKRKMKPSRNIPEKFGTLNADQKRFLINRLKIPPSSNKCCTNCFKRISKDIEDLLLGELKSEFNEFKKRSTIREERGIDEEEELIKHNIGVDGLGINKVWPSEGQPPFKELKLDEEIELDEESQSLMKLKKELTEQEELIAEERPSLGSITKGTPNRPRNLLIETSLSQPNTEINNIDLLNATKQKTIQDLLTQFTIANASNDSIKASELNIQINKLLETFPIELLFNNFQSQQQSQQQFFGQNNNISEPSLPIKEEIITVKLSNELPLPTINVQQQIKKEIINDNLKRKSGLANVLLPSPVITTTITTTTTTNTLDNSINQKLEENLIRGISKSFSSSLNSLQNKEKSKSPQNNIVIPIIEKQLLEQQQQTTTNLINSTEITKTDFVQENLSSCYESLSDDSNDDEMEKNKNQKMEGKNKINEIEIGMNVKILTSQIKSNSTNNNSTNNNNNKSSSSSNPLPTFFSLFDFMDEGGNEKEEVIKECLEEEIPGTSSSLSKQISSIIPPFSSSTSLPQSSSSSSQQKQKQPTISNFFQTISTVKKTENEKEICKEECLYEPLSSDEET